MSHVEPVRVTVPECAHSKLCAPIVHLSEQSPEHRRTDARALSLWVDIEVIQEQVAAFSNDYHETNANSGHFDMARGFGGECREKAASRPPGVESADSLQALAHGYDAQLRQRLPVPR